MQEICYVFQKTIPSIFRSINWKHALENTNENQLFRSPAIFKVHGEENGVVFCPLIVVSNRRQLLSFRGLSYSHYDWISWPVAMSDDREVKTEERPSKVLRLENDTFALTCHATGTVGFWIWLVSWHGCPNYSSTKANIFFFYPDMNGSFPPSLLNQEN